MISAFLATRFISIVMGNHCTRSEPDDSVTRSKFSIGKDYQEINGQTAGSGCKTSPAWSATITRQQLENKREEFWRTRTTGRRHVWMAIKSAVEADHETAAVLLQMAGITMRNGNISLCEDTNGNVYEVPPFVINDPVAFANEKKQKTAKPKPVINESIKVKIRRPGKEQDVDFDLESMIPVSQLKQMYAEKEELDPTKIRMFFGGRELKDDQTLASYYIRNQMVVQVFLKS